MTKGNPIATRSFRHLAVFSLLLYMGCGKNETPVDEPKFTGLAMQAISKDAFRLKVSADDVLLTEYLTTPNGNIVYSNVKYYDTKHRIQVTDYYTSNKLLDTTIFYRPGLINKVTFFQPSAGAPLTYIGPPVNEALPETGYTKIAIAYTLDELPESVKVVVQNTVPDGPVNYVDTDSFILNKGVFSKYFRGLHIAGKRARVKFYSTQPDQKLLAEVSADAFDSSNPDFSAFLFAQATGPVNGVYTIIGQNLY